jgi:hypothetical protein
MSESPFLHEASGTIRFWVLIEGELVGASVSRESLHYRYRPDARDEDPLETFKTNSAHLEATVRHRVAGGSLKPVLLREFDLRNELAPGLDAV